MFWGLVILALATVQAGQVMSTKKVKAESVVETMTETVTRGGVVGVDQTWHYTEEFKAIIVTGSR